MVVSLIIMVVMIVIAVFTIRFQAGLRAELSRSDSDMRLTNPRRIGYCTTISSDIEVKRGTEIDVTYSDGKRGDQKSKYSVTFEVHVDNSSS